MYIDKCIFQMNIDSMRFLRRVRDQNISNQSCMKSIRYPLVLYTLCIIFITCRDLNLYMITIYYCGQFCLGQENKSIYFIIMHIVIYFITIYILLLFAITTFPEEDYKSPPVSMLTALPSAGVCIPSVLTQVWSCYLTVFMEEVPMPEPKRDFITVLPQIQDTCYSFSFIY